MDIQHWSKDPHEGINEAWCLLAQASGLLLLDGRWLPGCEGGVALTEDCFFFGIFVLLLHVRGSGGDSFVMFCLDCFEIYNEFYISRMLNRPDARYSPIFVESCNPSRMARTVNPVPCWQLPCEAPLVAAGPCAPPSFYQAFM